MEEITTWLTSRLSESEVRPLQPRGDQFIWRIDRPGSEVPPVYLKIPGDYLRSSEISRQDLTTALDREDLDVRVAAADSGAEAAWLLTRDTAGGLAELTLVESDPPASAGRRVPKPAEAPGRAGERVSPTARLGYLGR